MEYKDYYKILGIEKTASAEEIKKAYRRLAKKYHPDNNPGDKQAEEKFKEISEAYEVVGNAENRKKYDEIGSGGFNPNGFSGFGGNGGNTYTRTSTEGGGFSDFFNMFFGGGFNSRRESSAGRRSTSGFGGASYTSGMPVDGQDTEGETHISLSEGLGGAERIIRVGQKKIKVKIPAGICSGEKIKIAGQGLPGRNGGRDGNLYLKVSVDGSEGFRLNGLDIETDVDIYPWEAALGCKKEVAAVDSRIIINVPAGIQTGSKIRAAGKGYISKSGKRGDLFLKMRIVNPTVITDEAKNEFKKLKSIYER